MLLMNPQTRIRHLKRVKGMAFLKASLMILTLPVGNNILRLMRNGKAVIENAHVIIKCLIELVAYLVRWYYKHCLKHLMIQRRLFVKKLLGAGKHGYQVFLDDCPLGMVARDALATKFAKTKVDLGIT
ncbi:uncharacterized protein LOC110638879 isoform X2 [Hevea brasiliensis]|uniref:uncharacterized protein LOC110638879 isoform X2 n=1 Tax=Hevea brasiliensis TaxID=3981 RepID=UPI00260155F2|nr:uncharacterized protein LOC110638879 isoform X2 [Hevea brasiliensis]